MAITGADRVLSITDRQWMRELENDDRLGAVNSSAGAQFVASNSGFDRPPSGARRMPIPPGTGAGRADHRDPLALGDPGRPEDAGEAVPAGRAAQRLQRPRTWYWLAEALDESNTSGIEWKRAASIPRAFPLQNSVAKILSLPRPRHRRRAGGASSRRDPTQPSPPLCEPLRQRLNSKPWPCAAAPAPGRGPAHQLRTGPRHACTVRVLLDRRPGQGRRRRSVSSGAGIPDRGSSARTDQELPRQRASARPARPAGDLKREPFCHAAPTSGARAQTSSESAARRACPTCSRAGARTRARSRCSPR